MDESSATTAPRESKTVAIVLVIGIIGFLIFTVLISVARDQKRSSAEPGASADSGSEVRRDFAKKMQQVYETDEIPLTVAAEGSDASVLAIYARQARMIDIGVTRYQADRELHDTMRKLGFRAIRLEYSDPKPKTIEVDLTR